MLHCALLVLALAGKDVLKNKDISDVLESMLSWIDEVSAVGPVWFAVAYCICIRGYQAKSKLSKSEKDDEQFYRDLESAESSILLAGADALADDEQMELNMSMSNAEFQGFLQNLTVDQQQAAFVYLKSKQAE
jgi:hypothetical protein